MNFLALFVGLALERLLTHLFHLREFHWLDPIFDRGLRRLAGAGRNLTPIGVAALAILVVLPVVLVSIVLAGKFAQVLYFVFAVLVLLFSLGPRDLAEEVSDYCVAMENDNADELQRVATELLEQTPTAGLAPSTTDIESAIYMQANNRIFGVVFWFALLGPTGAWLFRVMDLMRRRADVFLREAPDAPGRARVTEVVHLFHGILAWAPARLLMVGYALAGSFEEAVSAWRSYYAERAGSRLDLDETVVGHVGRGAVGASAAGEPPPADAVQCARLAIGLVSRTLLLIWCPVLALLTLYDWLR